MTDVKTPGRLLLRNFDPAQKLLTAAIVATVLAGYLAAAANLFEQDAPKDGVQTITLEQFPDVYRKKGIRALFHEVQASLGVHDVIRKYHGSGDMTRLESALNGTMKTKIVENITGGDASDAKMNAYCEQLRQDLIQWSRLPPELRQATYRDGVPFRGEEGLETVDFSKLASPGGKTPGAKENRETVKTEATPLKPLIVETLRDNCVTCHAPGSSDSQAKNMPLNNFAAVDVYCRPDHGVPVKQLALTSHVHLLGFSVLFAMTGFLFSATSFPTPIRCVFAPFTLTVQLAEICCWWLAKAHVAFAYGVFYLGPLVGVGLLIQCAGVLFELAFRRRQHPNEMPDGPTRR